MLVMNALNQIPNPNLLSAAIWSQEKTKRSKILLRKPKKKETTINKNKKTTPTTYLKNTTLRPSRTHLPPHTHTHTHTHTP